MNWDDLRFFLAVCREGTLTRAAKVLGVNHTTVSRRIQALQDQTGVRLFDRFPDRWVPTAAGDQVFEIAEDVETRMLGLESKVLGQDERLSGLLRVSTLDLIASRCIDILGDFRAAYPGIDLEVAAENAAVSLSRREADVVVRVTNGPPEHLVGRKLVRIEYALYAAETLIERLGSDTSPADYPWLAWAQRMGARLTEAWMTANVPDANVVLHLDDVLVFEEAIRRGVGIGFLPCIDGDADPAMRRLRPVEPGFGIDVWILTHPDLRSAARVRAFVTFFSDRVAALQDHFAGKHPRKPDVAAALRAGG